MAEEATRNLQNYPHDLGGSRGGARCRVKGVGTAPLSHSTYGSTEQLKKKKKKTCVGRLVRADSYSCCYIANKLQMGIKEALKKVHKRTAEVFLSMAPPHGRIETLLNVYNLKHKSIRNRRKTKNKTRCKWQKRVSVLLYEPK
jgi:hypothetical protein